MKGRILVYVLFSLIVSLALVAFGTRLELAQAGQSADFSNWLPAHAKTPLLWLLDTAAVCQVIFMVYAGTQVGRAQQQTQAHAELASEQLRMQEEQHRQVEALIGRNVQLEKQVAELEERDQEHSAMVASLEASLEQRQGEFEAEARRLTEQAFRALQGQVEANARQLDAVNLAMQYQRAELRELRHGMRALHPAAPEPAQIARLTPAEIAAITDNTSLAEYDAEPVAQNAHSLDASPKPPHWETPAPPLTSLAVTERRNEVESPATGSDIRAQPSASDFSAVPPVTPPPFVHRLYQQNSIEPEVIAAPFPLSPEEQAQSVPEVSPDDFGSEEEPLTVAERMEEPPMEAEEETTAQTSPQESPLELVILDSTPEVFDTSSQMQTQSATETPASVSKAGRSRKGEGVKG